ncbi:hypothetical protein [Zoogloea sp.]|uniref:hypothetical protein n=1 Tax=Zoogloea sp. TaxID=49181 RepID=UPI0035AFF054
MAVLILLSGLATRLFRGVEVTLVLFAFSFAYLLRKNSVFDKRYLIACFVWFSYVVFSYIKYPGENYFWPFLYFCNLTIVFAVVRFYGEDFFRVYSSVMYYVSAYSLFLFGFQLLSVDAMYSIWSAFDMSGSLFDKPYTYYAHTLFYTIHQFRDVSKGVPRNAGFCWEPGVFSCFIVMAIYFQLVCDSYKVDRSKLRYLVFFIALLTTQSTTGLTGALVVFVGYLLNLRRESRGKYMIFALLIALPLAVVLPEQLDKIEEQLSEDLAEQVLMIDASEHEKGLGRFQSIYILAIDFLDNPILGVGANRESTWVSRMGIDANPTSGIGNMVATYGMFLMLPFLLVLAASSKAVAARAGGRAGFVLFVVMIVLGFSFSVIETPIFLSIVFWGYFCRCQSRAIGGCKV